MLNHLPGKEIPDWLVSLTPEKATFGEFPYRQVLDGSLYYPACALDDYPIRRLGGNVYSFVYADYSVRKEEFDAAVKNTGFKGYALLCHRPVGLAELCPGGWKALEPSDGSPRAMSTMIQDPYAAWAIWERRADLPESHGPKRFSFLFLRKEGVEAYAALFNANGLRPYALAIIKPGHALGGNWTNFEDPNAILARVVKRNLVGIPDVFLHGFNPIAFELNEEERRDEVRNRTIDKSSRPAAYPIWPDLYPHKVYLKRGPTWFRVWISNEGKNKVGRSYQNIWS
jgi:hypothetical protein